MTAAITDKAKPTAANTDGGWERNFKVRSRYATPTGLMSYVGESAWKQYDPQMLLPKEWGKTNEQFTKSLRDWPDPDSGTWQTGQHPTWKNSVRPCARSSSCGARSHLSC